MKLTNLVFESELLNHLAKAGQIVGEDGADPKALYQRFQEAADSLRIAFVDLTERKSLSIDNIHGYQHWLIFTPSQGIGSIKSQNPDFLPPAFVIEQVGLFLQVAPDGHMAQVRSEYIQDQRNTSQTQVQHPTNGCQLAQLLCLVRSFYAFWVVSKGLTAPPAAISKHMHMTNLSVFHWFIYLTPALKYFAIAIWAMMRSLFCISLDFWKAKDDN